MLESRISFIHFAIETSNQESQFKSLLLVQSRIAERRVPLTQALLCQTGRAAYTLGDSFTGEFEVHAAQEGARGTVDLQRLVQFGEDVTEVARLDAGGGGLRVAVHGVALPDRDVAGGLHGGDMGGEVIGDLFRAVARDEGHLADLARRVDNVEDADELVRGHAGADLDANRVGDAAEELDVGAVELARAITDPEEVRGGRVVVCWWRVRGCVGGGLEKAREALLVFEGEALVAGVDVDGFDAAVSVDADGVHKAQGVFDPAHDLLVLLFNRWRDDMAQSPVEWGVQISQAGGERGADVVQGGGGVEVGGDESRGIGFAGYGVCGEAVDVVASEGGHLYTVDDFHGTRSWSVNLVSGRVDRDWGRERRTWRIGLQFAQSGRRVDLRLLMVC